jgi:hypothetical protein
MERSTKKIILTLASLSVFFLPGCPLQNTGRDSPGFSWSAADKGKALPEMMPGELHRIQFEFIPGEGISQLAFEITDPDLKKMGISIHDKIVPVIEGRASSQVIFEIEQGTRPWRYALEIVARDDATGSIVGRGTVPFAVYPYSSIKILDCSC